MIRGRIKPKPGDVLVRNDDWIVVMERGNKVVLKNLKTMDEMEIPFKHLLSLSAIVEEVKRTYEGLA